MHVFTRRNNRYIGTWSPEEDAQVRRLVEDGASNREIADAMPGRTERSIEARRRRLCIVAPRKQSPQDEKPSRPEEHVRAPVLTPQEASIWHLIDLKRAGHSPRFTELHIEPMGAVGRIVPEPCMTYRSPAAMLSEG